MTIPRRSPLPRRQTWLRRKGRPKRPPVEWVDESEAYKAFVRDQECRVAVSLGHRRECRGPIHAAHLGRRGLGQLADWRTIAPLCEWHHLRDSHDHATKDGKLGFLASMNKWDRRAWYDDAIAATWSLWEAWNGRVA